jgi:hypothetical protein
MISVTARQFATRSFGKCKDARERGFKELPPIVTVIYLAGIQRIE